MKILDKSGYFCASTAGMVVFCSDAPGRGGPKAQNFCSAKVHAMQSTSLVAGICYSLVEEIKYMYLL